MDGTPQVFTAVQECDARLAICRGLAEYIEGISFQSPGGRLVRFTSVHEEYAEPEDDARYPSAAILLQGSGTYDASRSMVPSQDEMERLPQPDGRSLIVMCDYVQNLNVEVVSTDPLERSGLVMALERAFMPSASKFSFALNLPFYFGVRAVYALQELNIDDSSDNVMQRVRKANFTLQATVPLVQLFSFPDLRPSFTLESVGSGPDVLVSLSVS